MKRASRPPTIGRGDRREDDRRELRARTRPEEPRDQRDERAEAEREEGRARGGPRRPERTRVDAELVAGVRFERQSRGRASSPSRHRAPCRDRHPGPCRCARARRSPRAGGGASSRRSMASSRSSSSRCAFIDTYSPAAIEKAPATRPATPAVRTIAGRGAGAGDAEDERHVRHEAVADTEHARPRDAPAHVAMVVLDGRRQLCGRRHPRARHVGHDSTVPP